MEAKIPHLIKLSDSEQRLYNKIEFGRIMDHKKAIKSAKASHKLMDSLIERKAIPQIRLAYFSDPDLNPREKGNSYLQNYNRTLNGRNLFEDGNFINRFLRYFIFGPDLSQETMREFCKILNKDERKGELNDLLHRFVRNEVQKVGTTRRYYLREEFYKLALECVPEDPFLPERIRKAGMETQ